MASRACRDSCPACSMVMDLIIKSACSVPFHGDQVFPCVTSTSLTRVPSLVFTLPGRGALAAAATAWRICFGFAPFRDLIKPDVLVLCLVRRFHLYSQVAYIELRPEALVKGIEH